MKNIVRSICPTGSSRDHREAAPIPPGKKFRLSSNMALGPPPSDPIPRIAPPGTGGASPPGPNPGTGPPGNPGTGPPGNPGMGPPGPNPGTAPAGNPPGPA